MTFEGHDSSLATIDDASDDTVANDNRLAVDLHLEDFATPSSHAGRGGTLVEDVVILASAEKVRQVLLDVSAWPQSLPFVQSAEITYDDGLYQEFSMVLEAIPGRTVTVRTVRRCEADRVTFFQPEPGRFLKHRSGTWFLRPLARNATRVTLAQRWTLSDQARTTGQRVTQEVHDRSRAALAALKRRTEAHQA